METKTEIIHKPLPVNRNGHPDVLYMSKAYAMFVGNIIDYVFVNHEIPTIQ